MDLETSRGRDWAYANNRQLIVWSDPAGVFCYLPRGPLTLDRIPSTRDRVMCWVVVRLGHNFQVKS